MFERQPIGSAGFAARFDGSLIVPVLIGATWLALAVASIAALDEMGRTMAEARAAKDLPAEGIPVTATCRCAAAGTISADGPFPKADLNAEPARNHAICEPL